ncbi:MAG: serine/threonine protein kinase [Bradymonadales bacterium]|nr:MAG: serine/threonine protein kinase [Bradymonadales bacterium]
MSSWVGKKIQKYQILEKIESGGMATVYRAKDTVLERDVALKIIHEHLGDLENINERFSLEAKVVAKLRHPNIVAVYDYFEWEGRPCVVMEYVPGLSAAKLVKDSTAIPENYVLMIGLELLYGLREAHSAGVLHRDIKPGNCLASPKYGVKLSDFGLAKVMGEDQHLTQDGHFVGTLSYSSPEQIQGLPLDERTDVFSMGLTLFMLALRMHAFKKKGDSQNTLVAKIITGSFQNIDQSEVDMTQDFQLVLNKALQIDLNERYQGAQEMIEDIESILIKRQLMPYQRYLLDFLKDPLHPIPLDATRVTSTASRFRVSPMLLKKSVGAAWVGALGGVFLFLLIQGIWPFEGSYPDPQSSLLAAGEARVFENEGGVQLTLIQLEPPASNEYLVLPHATGSAFDGRPLLTRFGYGHVTTLFMAWKGGSYTAVTSERGSGRALSQVRLRLPYSSTYYNLTYREQTDPTPAIRAALGWKPEFSSSIRRSREINRLDSQLASRLQATNRHCQTSYQIEVSWASLDNNHLRYFDSLGTCGMILAAIDLFCRRDGFQGNFRNLKTLTCEFGGEPLSIQYLEDQLTTQFSLNGLNSFKDLVEFFSLQLSHQD